MNHGLRSGVSPVNLKMKKQFAGAEPASGNYIPIQIGETDVRRFHVPFANHGGSTQHVLVAQPAADVAAISIDILTLPQLAPGGHDLGLQSLRL